MTEPTPPLTQKDSGVLPSFLSSPSRNLPTPEASCSPAAEHSEIHMSAQTSLSPTKSHLKPSSSDVIDLETYVMKGSPIVSDRVIKSEEDSSSKIVIDLDEYKMMSSSRHRDPVIKSEVIDLEDYEMKHECKDDTPDIKSEPTTLSRAARYNSIKPEPITPPWSSPLGDASDETSLFVKPSPGEAVDLTASDADEDLPISDAKDNESDDDLPDMADEEAMREHVAKHKKNKAAKEAKKEAKKAAKATDAATKAATKAAKKSRAPAKTAEEAFKRRYEDSLQKEKTEADRRIKQGIKKRKARKASKNKMKGFGSAVLKQMNNSNVANGSRGFSFSTPMFSASSKARQFELLIAHCPATADKRKCAGEIAALRKASVSFGHLQVQAVDSMWLLIGMKSLLYGYQLIGVAWMLNREFSLDSPEGPFGGICADGMGLGKTVQTIATMVANQPNETDPEDCRTTLIVVPSSLLLQWVSEIARHAPDRFPRVLVYRRKDKIARIMFTSCDVVLTTWHELNQSVPWPDADTLLRLRQLNRVRKDRSIDDESSPIVEWIEDHQEEGGNLHQIYWRRIVLDESHMIKNHLSKFSFAANALKGKFRWSLSGTPIMNRLEEFYPYFRFLKDPAATLSYRTFKGEYCDAKDEDCMERLDTLLAKTMFRRSMEDTILGRPIVEIPLPIDQVVRLSFSPEEQILYRAFEDRLREFLNAHFADDDERKSLSYVLPQITRLRQITTHPLLIENQIRITFELEDLQDIKRKLQALNSEDHTLLDRVSTWINEKKFGISGPEDDAEEGPQCLICQDMAVNPKIINVRGCKHIFCDVCIEAHIERGLEDEDPEMIKCPECHCEFDEDGDLKDANSKGGRLRKSPGSSKKKGKDFFKFHPHIPPSGWLEKSDNGSISLLQSAKLRAVLEEVRGWIRDAPEEKGIIFTQWRGFQAIIGRMLEAEGIPFIYYSGDLSQESRDRNVRHFEAKPEIKIMVSGLKVGSLGLNLAFATRVISVDPWWNSCVELQAFHRVYRLPQAKTTYYTRFIVNNSIEARIAALQEQKFARTDSAMSVKASVEEMAGLFGR